MYSAPRWLAAAQPSTNGPDARVTRTVSNNGSSRQYQMTVTRAPPQQALSTSTRVLARHALGIRREDGTHARGNSRSVRVHACGANDSHIWTPLAGVVMEIYGWSCPEN